MSVPAWSGRPSGSFVFASLPTIAVPGFYMATGDLNSVQHTYIASTLQSGPSSQLPIKNLKPLHCNGDKQALGDEETAQRWLGVLAALSSSGPWFASQQPHTEPLTSACDSNCQGVSTLFWLPCALHLYGRHTNAEAKYSCTQNKSKSIKQTKPCYSTPRLRHGGQAAIPLCVLVSASGRG